MSQPDTVSHGERRHYPRIILESPARLDAEGCASVLVVATDISTTGVGLLCDAEGTRVLRELLAAPNSSCDIAIVLPEGYEKDEIRATARVAWVGNEEPAEFAAGLEFIAMSASDRAYVQQMADEAYEDARAALMQLMT